MDFKHDHWRQPIKVNFFVLGTEWPSAGSYFEIAWENGGEFLSAEQMALLYFSLPCFPNVLGGGDLVDIREIMCSILSFLLEWLTWHLLPLLSSTIPWGRLCWKRKTAPRSPTKFQDRVGLWTPASLVLVQCCNYYTTLALKGFCIAKEVCWKTSMPFNS